MKGWRFGIGQTPTTNPLRRSRRLKITLTERQREKCVRCNLTRWEHERDGLVPDHDFVQAQTPSRSGQITTDPEGMKILKGGL